MPAGRRVSTGVWRIVARRESPGNLAENPGLAWSGRPGLSNRCSRRRRIQGTCTSPRTHCTAIILPDRERPQHVAERILERSQARR